MNSLNPPLNRRQERFCHAFVEYGCTAVAAVEAGYNRPTARQQGWRLLQDRRVKERIGEIQAGLAGQAGNRRDVLMGKLEVVYRRALQDHHYHAAARAVELQARLSGFAIALRNPARLPDPAAANDGGPSPSPSPSKAVAGLLAPPLPPAAPIPAEGAPPVTPRRGDGAM